MAKRTKPVYDVLKVNNTDVLDFMTFSKRNMPNRTIAGDGSKVEWTKIHSFQYRKEESEKVFFKYEIGDANYKLFNTKQQKILKRKRSNTSILEVQAEPQQMYDGVTALCSKGPMSRRSYVQKVLCSEGPLFRRFYVQKVPCSEGSIFRRFYVQKVLCSERFVQKVLWLESTLAIKQYYLFNLSESVYIYNKKYVF